MANNNDTKACIITENEVRQLIVWHGYNLNDEGKVAPDDMNERIERISYLNKRLKAFKEPEEKAPETKVDTATATEQQPNPPATDPNKW